MIFVTVGTHEQPFDRLVKYVDELRKTSIDEEIIIQTGFCEYKPQFCEYSKLFSYEEMTKFVNDARIIITHGGPSSFFMPLQIGKIPIVVPRQKKYEEHVNDHQLEFAREVAVRKKNIIVIEEINLLEDVILNYNEKIKELTNEVVSNNQWFNEKFESIVSELL